jgi:hypothetical protein
MELGALVGKIQLLQQLLGETPKATAASWSNRPTSVLRYWTICHSSYARARIGEPP